MRHSSSWHYRDLSQLDNEQVTFSAKQWKLRAIKAVAGAILECESYLVRLTEGAVVALVQMESKDSLY